MADNKEFIAAYGLVPRDASELLDVPLEYRWEFTRRHPYYLLFWPAARGYRRNEFAAGTAENESGLVAMYLLGMIGVTGEPEDPALSFDALGETDPALLSGSVLPMTLRATIINLISALPRAELEILRAVLDVAVNPEYAVPEDQDLALQKRKAQSYLVQFSSARLDSYPDSPLYYIHLDASQNRIVEDVETFVRGWKKRRNIPERRTRITEFADYLKVWDLREGWKDGAYHVEAEQTFSQIAKELRLPKSTVANAYRAAFKRIVGQEFDPELWIRVMGLMKLPALEMPPDARLTARYRRLLSSNAPKPVPESRVEHKPVEHGDVGLVERESSIESDQVHVDLELDISELIQHGLTDIQIAEKLELQDVGLIGYFRSRLAEMKEMP